MNVWLEKTLVWGRPDRKEGEHALGKCLWSPQTSASGADIYKNMKQVQRDDIIIHLVDDAHFVGISIVDSEADDSFICLPNTQWGGRPGFLIKLREYKEFSEPISREDFLKEENKKLLLEIREKYENLFYTRELLLREGGYLTALPPELLNLLNEIHKKQNGEYMPYVEKAPEPDLRTISVGTYTGFEALLLSKNQIIFYGPPGTGKTCKARELAVEFIEKGGL